MHEKMKSAIKNLYEKIKSKTLPPVEKEKPLVATVQVENERGELIGEQTKVYECAMILVDRELGWGLGESRHYWITKDPLSSRDLKKEDYTLSVLLAGPFHRDSSSEDHITVSVEKDGVEVEHTHYPYSEEEEIRENDLWRIDYPFYKSVFVTDRLGFWKYHRRINDYGFEGFLERRRPIGGKVKLKKGEYVKIRIPDLCRIVGREGGREELEPGVVIRVCAEELDEDSSNRASQHVLRRIYQATKQQLERLVNKLYQQ